MKRHLVIISLFMIFFVLVAFATNARAFMQETYRDTQATMDPFRFEDSVPAKSAMGARPVPSYPRPKHDPGQPARATTYTTQMTRINAKGVEDAVQLTGLDALIADGVIDDPLAGNYKLIDLDKFMFSSYDLGGSHEFEIETWQWLSPTLVSLTQTIAGDHRFNDTASGDLNGDYRDEQIAAWVDVSDDNHIYLSIGEMPGVLGVTSAPAVVVSMTQQYDFVRGYDEALWVHNGSEWQSGAGGRMLSGPAVASRSDGQFDVFAIGLDDDSAPPNYLVVWHNRWNGTDWDGWQAVDSPDDGWPTLQQDLPTPELDAPAVVANGSDLDLFWVGRDNTLRWCDLSGAECIDWQNLGGLLASGAGAVAHDDQIDVFALGLDDTLWALTYNYNGSSWGNWQRLDQPGMPISVTISSPPVAVSPVPNQVRVMVLGSDGGLWQLAYDGSSWGSWQGIDQSGMTEGVTIVSKPAMISPAANQVRVTSRGSDGGLWQRVHDGSSWGNWTLLEGLEVQREYKLDEAQTSPPGLDDYAEQTVLDVTTGHFTGDGREQIVLAYRNVNEITIEVYDIQNGFEPTNILSMTESIPNSTGLFPRIAAGDVTGDGLDEIGLVFIPENDKYELHVYKIDIGGLSKIFDSNPIHVENFFAGTLQIEAGNVKPDPDDPVTNLPTVNDEFVVVSDWASHNVQSGNGWFKADLSIYDYEADAFQSEVDQSIWFQDCSNCHLHEVGIGLTVGDVAPPLDDGEIGIDEIIVTWPSAFDGSLYWKLERDLVVFAWDVTTFSETDRFPLGGFSIESHLETVATGDLDQDLQDEITIFAYSSDINDFCPGVSATYCLAVFKYDGQALIRMGSLPTNYNSTQRPRAINLVMGDFTDESVRVGPPSYRVQNAMNTPEVFLNLPPMHKDIVENDQGNNEELIFINDATASYQLDTGSGTIYSTQSRRDWELSTGFETSVGAFGNNVEASLENTYGAGFENTTTEINSHHIVQTTNAVVDDRIKYNATRYAIWEYPVIVPSEDSQDDPYTIAVVFPLVDTTDSPITTSGNVCDENYDIPNFYVPGHQIYNVWSYNPIGGSADFDDVDEEIYCAETDGSDEYFLTWDENTTVSHSNNSHNQINAGLEYSYENSLNIPVLGSVFEYSFRAYANGSYGHENMSTLTTENSTSTGVNIDMPPCQGCASWSTNLCLYWAKAGYLVLDYQTNPSGDVGWQYYNKADPAFILPWYGFPSLSNPEPPRCGIDKQLFTHEIDLDPAYVQNGDTVTMTATVRNFSNVNPPGSVKVNFYLDYPAADNQIGTCFISNLDRDLGPKQCAATWMVSGSSGVEKIYAEIDPDHAFDEMHDEDDVINNNIGYGLLHVASADYYDPGLRKEQAFQTILFEDAPGLGFGLYLPTANISETIRYELVPGSLGDLSIVGSPIQVLAFPGGSDEPEDPHFFGSIPAGMMAIYRDSDLLPGIDENNLRLYRLANSDWIEATCNGYDITRFPGDNRILVPICQAGIFALSDETPHGPIFLPYIVRLQN